MGKSAYLFTIKVLKVILVISFIISSILFMLGIWDINTFLVILLKIVLSILGGLVLIRFIYHVVLEKYHCEVNREKSKVLLAEEIDQIRQVSGPTRVGKDSSTIGAATLLKEYFIKKDFEELAEIRKTLYIYDFHRIDAFLDQYSNSKHFLVAGKPRLMRAFMLRLSKNEAFIKDYYLRSKKIDPVDHVRQYKLHGHDRVQKYNFDDGITPGGIPFIDILFDYFILYIHHVFIVNFIMSNQPIIESFEIKKDGYIDKLYSKKFSQKYIRIKEDNPMPLPLRGLILETEQAIMLSNTDKANDQQTKAINGIREFYTTVGHTTKESIIMYSITQNPHRMSKSIRELFQVYMHVFKQEKVVTSPIRRNIIDLYNYNLKFKISMLRSLDYLCLHLRTTNLSISIEQSLEKSYKALSINNQRSIRLYNNGYLKTYIGVYQNEFDIMKKVKFPKFSVILENKNNNTIIYPAFGFVQYNRIKDTWGKYNTHYMYFLRAEKEKKHKMHYNDVPNWDSMEPGIKDIDHMSYPALNSMAESILLEDTDPLKEAMNLNILTKLSIHQPEKFNKLIKSAGLFQRAKDFKKEIKNKQTSISIPLFDNLTVVELINLGGDYGFEKERLKLDNWLCNDDTFYKELIQSIKLEWKKINAQ